MPPSDLNELQISQITAAILGRPATATHHIREFTAALDHLAELVA